MWFKKLMGFEEKNCSTVRKNIVIDGDKMRSLVNGKVFQHGTLEILSLAELEKKAPLGVFNDAIKVEQIVANVQDLHKDVNNRNAMFQAASQFNLLEMIGPHISPENGVDRYENDYTQGPACAIACGVGTIYRNYFVPVKNQIGQTRESQIDCLELIGETMKNDKLNLWNMRNGYALPSKKGILHINSQILAFNDEERNDLKSKLKVGIQFDSEVTISITGHKVSQVYCSAMPVAYMQLEPILIEPFAQLILEATYEAAFYAALINKERTGCNKLYLTLVGGGAFGNKFEWIKKAIEKALAKFQDVPLDVKIVSFSGFNFKLQELCTN